jgi:cobalt-zinc-cadmium efflux system outer membrane protein
MDTTLISAGERKRGTHVAMFIVAVATLTTPSSPYAAPASRSPPGATVQELLVLVRKLNPELAAAALDTEAAVAKIVPAGSLDDPMVNVTRDQGFLNTVSTISQEFPLWGKLGLRADVAAATAKATKGQQDSVQTQLEERLKIAFAQYYAADRAITVTHDIHGLLHAVADTARARYAQGLVSQSDVIRADLEQARLDTELAKLEESRESAKAKINALIARPANAPLARPQSLRKVPAVSSLSLPVLVAKARERNPKLASARAEIAAAEGERKLVDRSWYPDITVTAGNDSLPGLGPRFVGGVGLKVPLQWGVRDAQAQAATARKGAAQLRLDAELLNIESELKSALAMLNQAQRTGNLLRTTLSQQSEAAYNSTLSFYQQGLGDLTSVLDISVSKSRSNFLTTEPKHKPP